MRTWTVPEEHLSAANAFGVDTDERRRKPLHRSRSVAGKQIMYLHVIDCVQGEPTVESRRLHAVGLEDHSAVRSDAVCVI